MTEPSRVLIVRPHQNVNQFAYQTAPDQSREQALLIQQDYRQIGWDRLQQMQTLPLREHWPITVGNALATLSSGLLGGSISRRMARNLSLHVTLSTLPTSGACLLIVTMAHLSAHYLLVLQPMFSDDPMLCSTCLEIRSFALASSIPVAMGTSVAVLANLSACLMNKTLRLPRFHIRAYPEWSHFFRKHAFKGMSKRYFFAYPLANGFLASMVFLGQNYYWRNHLQQRLRSSEKPSLPPKEARPRNPILGSVQDFFTKLFSSKTK